MTELNIPDVTDDDRHRQHAHGWCRPDALTFLDTGKKADQ